MVRFPGGGGESNREMSVRTKARPAERQAARNPSLCQSAARTKKRPQGPALQGGHSSQTWAEPQQAVPQLSYPLAGLYPPGTFPVGYREEGRREASMVQGIH